MVRNKCPGKYPGSIYVKVFTSSLLQICKITRNFDKIRNKMGNNPVAKIGKYSQK